jgi:hypothetical protein
LKLKSAIRLIIQTKGGVKCHVETLVADVPDTDVHVAFRQIAT